MTGTTISVLIQTMLRVLQQPELSPETHEKAKDRINYLLDKVLEIREESWFGAQAASSLKND